MSTLKQRKAIAKVIENHGNVSRAMLEAGYTRASARNPKNLTESNAWKKSAKVLTDALINKVHLDGLKANRVISANITYGDADEKTNDFIEVPDHATRAKFLDMALKRRGIYAPEKTENRNLNVNVSFEKPLGSSPKAE